MSDGWTPTSATPSRSPSRQSLMTLRVYTAGPDGAVKERRAEVHVVATDPFDPYCLSQAWPPCACPRHRGRGR